LQRVISEQENGFDKYKLDLAYIDKLLKVAQEAIEKNQESFLIDNSEKALLISDLASKLKTITMRYLPLLNR